MSLNKVVSRNILTSYESSRSIAPKPYVSRIHIFFPFDEIGLLQILIPLVHGYVVGDTLNPYLEKNSEFIRNDFPLR